jgi:hypothetical protein
MAQLFDPMLEPGTVIDEETGLPVPNMPVVGPTVEAIDAGLETVAEATTKIPQPGTPIMQDPMASEAFAVDVPPYAPATSTSVTPWMPSYTPDEQAAADLPSEGEIPAAPVVPDAGGLVTTGYDTGIRLPTAGTSESIINKEIDLGSTTTTQKVKTAGAQKAFDDMSAAEQAFAKGADEEISGIKGQTQAETEKVQETAAAIATYSETTARIAEEERKLLAEEMDKIDRKIAELANTPREDFWGSRSEGQKLAAALSVGLGSYGQALTGSGQNVGMTILNSRIDQFNRVQDEKFERKMKEIDGMRASLATKREMKKLERENHLATKEAALAKIDQKLAIRMGAAKTSQQVGQAMQQSSKVQADLANTRAQRELEVAAQVSDTIKKKEIQSYVKSGLYREDGKDLTDSDVKNLEYYNRGATAFNELEAQGGVEREIQIAQRPAYQQFIKELQLDLEAYSHVNLLGTNAGKVWTGMNQLRSYQKLMATDPEAAKYFDSFEPIIIARLRKDTGAAIAQGEYWKQLREYFPTAEATPDTVRKLYNRRSEAMKTQFNTLGVRVKTPKE